MQGGLHTRVFRAFNTVNAVSAVSRDKALADAAFDVVEQRCAAYERLFSHTLPGSSLSRVNQAAGAPVEVELELAELVKQALGYCSATDGMFDITMGPVVALWDFHQGDQQLEQNAEARKVHVPSSESLTEALTHVSWRGVHVADRTIRLDDPEARIVLGGVAKGYIADGLVRLMKECGVVHGIVNLGGNVAVFGGKPDGSPWNVGLRVPRSSAKAEEQSFGVVGLTDGSVVTSGIYERCFTAPDGTFYHHILDPCIGMPAETDLASVSLVSELSLDGDGYTTALVVMGLERAHSFVEHLPGCEAVFVTRDNQVYATSGIGRDVPFSM